jgi:hypothetical protein
MRGLGIVVQVIREALWPHAPQGRPVHPIPEEEKRRVLELERSLRAELVRAQTDALRYRMMVSKRSE